MKRALFAVAFLVIGFGIGLAVGVEYRRESAAPQQSSADVASAVADTLTARLASEVLEQRRKSWRAEVQSNLRNMIIFQSEYFDRHRTYGSTVEQIDARISSNVRIEIRKADANGYTAVGTHVAGPTVVCAVYEGDKETYGLEFTYDARVPWCR